MQHTLIAVFDNRADADRAQDDLLLAGFKRDCVKISTSDPTGITDSVTGSTDTTSTTTTSATTHHHEGLGASIKHFFADIFGTDNSEHAQRYSDAVSRGHHVLTVVTESEPEVERAADVVERHGPVDIDEKHAQWTGAGQISHPETMRASGAGGLQQAAPAARQSGYSGSAQHSEDLLRPQGEQGLFAQQSLNDDVPMGTTYQEPMSREGESLQGSWLEGSALQAPGSTGSMYSVSLQGSRIGEGMQRDIGGSSRSGVRVFSRDTEMGGTASSTEPSMLADDDYYRNDWSRRYAGTGSFEDYQPAYSYGAEMARNPQYRDRNWNDVESDLRDTWERRHPEHSNWERFKAAIRHGWDRMTGHESHRSHWDSNYASSGESYDEYEPAYMYGSEMATSDTYRGRTWDESETALRSEWESRTPGDTSWERFKAAIRHGWDRTTS
ncbi:hypothetical protein GCM10027321_01610 [Massilia terrae]|uniref:Uncharacterized protein n=1 Tax=Massilia terrae TaxID=1811224 RepID=A0ABT2CU29_9BURK|nr:hypothetical protein [Massilia terrae]MCS0657477.1 hypothetical protein [Massilia terrae]